MKTFHALSTWPLRAKLLTIAGLTALAIGGVLLGPVEMFLPVLGIGIGFSAIGGCWLGPRWFLVPLVAMAVEIAIAVPLTALNPTGGETPVSVVLEAPFWTGIPTFIGALLGGIIAFVIEQLHTKREQTPA